MDTVVDLLWTSWDHIKQQDKEKKMNQKSRMCLIVSITVILVLAVTIPVQAKKAVNFVVEFDLEPEDRRFATGTYEMVEAVILEDGEFREGTVTAYWIPRYRMYQGTMYLEDNDGQSSMAIRFTLLKIAGGCGTGHFHILDHLLEGDYQLHGNGTVEMCAEAGRLLGSFEGWAELW